MSNCFEHELNIRRIRGTCKMGINLLLLLHFVFTLELESDVILSVIIGVWPYLIENPVKIKINNCALLVISPVMKLLPVYSGKQMVKGLFLIFSSKRSFLLRNNIIDVRTNH